MTHAALLTSKDATGDVRSSAKADVRLRKRLDENFDSTWRSLRGSVLTLRDADDTTQQHLVDATRRINYIKGGSKESILFGTAMRVASDIRRSSSYRREVAHPDPGADLEGGSRPDELVDQ